MCQHFGWPHDFWRTLPGRPPMRRREFLGYLDVMNKQIEGERASPDSWDGAQHDQGWAELRAARERIRAR